MNEIDPLSKDIYKYLNFNELPSYIEQANSAKIPTINVVTVSFCSAHFHNITSRTFKIFKIAII